MKMLVYISIPTANQSVDATLESIYLASTRNNPVLEITGVLFHTKNYFMQILEGPSDNVDRLMDSIKEDPRHHSLHIIKEARANYRSLTDWNMQPLNLTDASLFTPEQLEEATQLASHSITMDADGFAFMVTELLNQQSFQQALQASGA